MPTDNLLNQTALSKRGWTKTLIARFLPEPILKTNPRYKSAAPMKLWKMEDVEVAEASEEFAEAKSQTERRKASATKAVQTKTNALRADSEAFTKTIRIKVIPDAKLRELAVESRQMWYDETDAFSRFGRNAYEADETTVNRWCVNFIRHHLTTYDENLARMKGKTGVREIYPEFRNAILRKIAEAYPKYAEEARRQMESE